jgi:hypothetical protein
MEITEHVNKANKRIADFLALDQKREFLIEEAVELCKRGKEFSTEKINEITNKMNELARQGIVPPRKNVTVEMVKEYVRKIH